MAKDIAIIQVCFNVLDPFQKQLFERVKSHPNRSGYIKRLVQRDVEHGMAGAVQMPTMASVPIIDDFNIDGFI